MTIIYIIYFKHQPNVAYIGKTNRTIKRRLYEHIYNATVKKRKTKVYNWLRKNINAGYQPIIEALVETENGDESEIQLIQEYKDNGYILKNSTDGGEGITTGYKHNNAFCNKRKEICLQTDKWKDKDNPFYGKSGEHNHKSKAVYQYSLEGDFIKKFDSMRLAAINLGDEKYTKLISRACKTKESAYGFQWTSKYHDKLNPYIPKKKILTKEEIETAKDLLLNHQWSVNKLAKHFGVSRTQINSKVRNCC
jgi:hypothetical protein